MAYYKLLWGSRFCRDCGGKANKEWPLCVCKNTAVKEQCRPLGINERNFCEHCGGKDPGTLICPHCEQYPLDLSEIRNLRLNDSLRLPLPITLVAVPVLVGLLVALSQFGRFQDAKPSHRSLLYAFGFATIVVAPLKYIARLQKHKDLRVSRNAFRARHPEENATTEWHD